MHVNYELIKLILLALRDRPAAIPIHVKAIDDTSNFDEFPESDLDSSKLVFFSLQASLIIPLKFYVVSESHSPSKWLMALLFISTTQCSCM